MTTPRRQARARLAFDTAKFITDHPLNQGKRLKALLAFLGWQVRSRFSRGPIVYRWVNGSRVIVHRGDTSLTGNIYCGLHDFADMAYVLHVTRPDDLFVDVGANVGSYSVLACAVKGARGVCFEPVPVTFARLLDNIRINALSDRVEALNLGVADREGELAFTSAENCTNHVVADNENAPEAVRVKVLPLDAILKGRAPSMLKIDVEGFEVPVLKGAEATLANDSLHSVLLELNGSNARYGFSESDILGTMSRHGFVACSYEPFTRELRRLEGGGSLTGNTLFVRRPEVASVRVRQSSPFVVRGVQV